MKNERHASVFDRGYKLNLVARRRHAPRCLWVCALDDLKGEREKILPAKGSDSRKAPWAICSCVSIRMRLLLSLVKKKLVKGKETVLHGSNLSILTASIAILLLLSTSLIDGPAHVYFLGDLFESQVENLTVFSAKSKWPLQRNI